MKRKGNKSNKERKEKKRRKKRVEKCCYCTQITNLPFLFRLQLFSCVLMSLLKENFVFTN